MESGDTHSFPKVDPVGSGVRGRCPRCGQGPLFDGYLSLHKRCSHCGLDYGFADSGDGPAVFVILLIGFLVVGLALWMEVTHSPPFWLHLIIWVPLSIALCLWALRALKGVLINLQFRNSAREGKIDHD